MSAPTAFKIALPGGGATSALLDAPAAAQIGYVFAHGAGVGMDHPFMAGIASGLAARGIAILRFQFPYMEQGARRPDPPRVAQAAVRAAVLQTGKRLPGAALFAGGKSYGARMTSQAQAQQPLAGVRGLVFAGFPLHAPDEPAVERAAHLAQVAVPMLFLQGTRDPLANLALIRETTDRLGPRATLHVVEGGDHSFGVLVRSGRTQEQVREELLDTMAGWMRQHA